MKINQLACIICFWYFMAKTTLDFVLIAHSRQAETIFDVKDNIDIRRPYYNSTALLCKYQLR